MVITKAPSNEQKKTKRVLLVTHDQREVDNISPALEELGYEYRIARTGQKGIEGYEDFQPHLIILNALMPRGDSQEVCRAIRQERQDKDTKILVTSPVSSGTIMLQARVKWGADEVVLLPISLNKMVQLVAFLLGDLSDRPALRTHPVDLTVRRDTSLEIKTTKGKIPKKGYLAEIDIGRILVTIIRQNASGSLILGEGEEALNILLFEGRLLELQSGYLKDRALGDLLCKEGVLSEPDLPPLLEDARKGKKRLGVLLMARKIIDHEHLSKMLEHQIVLKVAAVFTWKDGLYQFHPGDPTSSVGEPRNMHLAKVAFRAACLGAEPDLFEERYKNWLDQRVTLAENSPIRPNLLDLNSSEKRLIFNINGKHTLREVITEDRADTAQTLSTISAMLRLGMLSR